MNKLRKLTLTALLTAGALVIFVLESQLPPLLPTIPGCKPGLANVFTLLALWLLDTPWALALVLLRVSLGSLLTGQTMAFFYSLAGGMAAFAVMALLIPRLPLEQLWAGSVLGALAHNLGQMAAALLLTSTPAMAYYLPVLLLFGLVTGGFTGLCAQLVCKRLLKSGVLHRKEIKNPKRMRGYVD